MLQPHPKGRNDMQSKEDIEKVHQAVHDADPDFEDDRMEVIHDSLDWVLGNDGMTAQQFIDLHIAEA